MSVQHQPAAIRPASHYQPFTELTQDQRLLRARMHTRQSARVQEVLDEQAEKAAARRFSDEPMTGFGDLDPTEYEPRAQTSRCICRFISSPDPECPACNADDDEGAL